MQTSIQLQNAQKKYKYYSYASSTGENNSTCFALAEARSRHASGHPFAHQRPRIWARKTTIKLVPLAWGLLSCHSTYLFLMQSHQVGDAVCLNLWKKKMNQLRGTYNLAIEASKMQVYNHSSGLRTRKESAAAEALFCASHEPVFGQIVHHCCLEIESHFWVCQTALFLAPRVMSKNYFFPFSLPTKQQLPTSETSQRRQHG